MKHIEPTNQQNSREKNAKQTLNRRNFLRLAGAGSLVFYAGMPLTAGPFIASDFDGLVPVDKKLSPAWVKSLFERGTPQVYKGDELKYIGMPVGGLYAGQVYLGGDGKLWFWDIFNKKTPSTGERHYAEPMEPNSPIEQGFAIKIISKGKTDIHPLNRSNFPDVSFRGEYPIGKVDYHSQPVSISLEAFSPFIPLSVDESDFPATIMRFTVKNNSAETVEATLFGWLENAVCHHNRSYIGKRRNQIFQHKGSGFLDCTVEKGSEKPVVQKPDITFEEWNNEKYTGWTTDGNTFGNGPIKKTAIPGYQGDVGGDTERVVNSHATASGSDAASRDSATGTLTSKKFIIERKFINFWIGGGNHKNKTCLNVIVDGKVVRSVTGMNDNKMTLQSINVNDMQGKEACIKVVDAETGAWGNIGVGRITFSDLPANPAEFEQLFDYGTMGLAILNDSANYAIANATLTGQGNVTGTNATTKLEDRLVGTIGHTMKLRSGESKVITFAITWHFPNLTKPGSGRYYASKFASSIEVANYLAKHIEKLYTQTKLWRDTWYDSTLPYWFLDRTFTNASTLATSTVFRFRDGKFWGWEGVSCCEGTCTHVYHYEQTMGRIFPELDIVLREKTDFNPEDSYKGGWDHRISGKGDRNCD